MQVTPSCTSAGGNPSVVSPDPEQYLNAINGSTDTAIFTVNSAGVVTSWNGGATRMLGFSPKDAIGSDLGRLFPGDTRELRDRIVSCTKDVQSFSLPETTMRTSDGSTLPISLKAVHISSSPSSPSQALCLVYDSSDVYQAQHAIQELQTQHDDRLLVLETASRVALDILTSATGVEALRHIVDTARLLTGARYAALGVARPNGQGLREFITVGLDSASEAAIGARPRGVGILGLLLTLEKPLRIDKLSAHPASVGFPPNHPPMTSFLGVPIRSGETVIGSLYLTDKIGASTFTEADEAAVVQIGSYAAVAIHNLILLSRQKSLVSGLIFAQEEERRAIAYDLHDGLTQYVMAAHAHIDSFRRLYREKHLDKAERELEHGMRYLKDAVVESRRLVNGVRSLALDDLGLAGAIEQLVVEEKERAEWETASFVHNLADRRFDRTVETAVYRIVQEALTNARKHSHAKNVRVMLVEHHDDETDQITLEVEVRDWGIGFEPNDAAAGEGHVGLQGMVERVHLLGGSLRFESKLGEGSAIMVQVPVIDVHTDTKQGSTNE